MGRKTIAIVIIVLGVLMLAGFVYIMFFDRLFFSGIIDKIKGDSGAETVIADPPDAENITVPSNEQGEIKRIIADPSQTVISEGNRTDTVVGEPLKTTRENLMRMAASFAERFGSYSNQSSFSNVVDLKIFMSQRMRNWADSYVGEQRRRSQENELYFGITTKAIAQEIKEFDDHIGKASVLVSTRRREATLSTGNVSKVFNQEIIINFVKENGAWKVDSASWQDKISLAE